MSNPIIIVNDVHLRDNPPSSATETYQDDLFDLIHQVAVKAKELKAQVVFAGDVIDFKQPARTSHKLVQRAIDAFREFDHALVTPGNHDLQQDRLDSLMVTQPLGVIVKSGALTVLDGWHPNLPLFGVPWQQAWHDPESRMSAFAEWRALSGLWSQQGENTPTVLAGRGVSPRHPKDSLVVTHAPLYPPGQENEFDHIPTQGDDGISAAMGNVGYLAYGHIHEDHGFYESEGVQYANVGALSRGSLQEYNRERQIAVSLWTPEDGFSRILLDYKPADEVFRLTEIDQAKQEKIDLDNFLAEVGQSTLAQSTTESVKDFIQNHQSVPPAVKKRALSILEDVS